MKGQVIVVTATRTSSKGVERMRFSKGWVSSKMGNGTPILQKL